MARVPAFQAGYAGSIPVTRSNRSYGARHVSTMAAKRAVQWSLRCGLLVVCLVSCSRTSAQRTAPAIESALPGPGQVTAEPAATTSTQPPRPGFSTAFAGDVLVHSDIWIEAEEYAGGTGYDFAPMWDDVRGLISSVDLAVCHLEVPIAPPGEEPSTYPFYGAPRELVTGIASAGWDRCSTASNHTFDRGTRGIDATLAAFDEEGLTQAGMARTADEIAPKVIEVDGVKVTHLSYTFGYNGLEAPAGQEWRSARTDAKRIVKDARTAKDLGAQAVIVSMHWGVEPLSEIVPKQRDLAEEITQSGLVDLVVGHHSHVVQPIEQVNGVWVVFGMGNHISAHPTREFFPPASQDGVIVTVDFEVNDDGSVDVARPVVHPTWVDKDAGYVIRDVLAQLARDDVPATQRRAYETSLERTAETVGPFVAARPGS